MPNDPRVKLPAVHWPYLLQTYTRQRDFLRKVMDQKVIYFAETTKLIAELWRTEQVLIAELGIYWFNRMEAEHAR